MIWQKKLIKICEYTTFKKKITLGLFDYEIYIRREENPDIISLES